VRAKDIDDIKQDLWQTAEILRTNSSLASNEYFLPIMGLLFLRHAEHRYLAAREEIERNMPVRGGKTRGMTKEDFSAAGAIYLSQEALYSGLVMLPDEEDRSQKIIAAMESIENDYDSLKGVLPKNEYNELENEVLGQIIRTLDPEVLKEIEGDVFGRIYEYFLTKFAGSKAHDDGEFFTPISLVSFISKMIEVENGIIFDPACGSGGMFVQSARLTSVKGKAPTEKLTFLGTEKNATTIRLAKMNLAVHGLEGNILQANSYYQDPHNLVGKVDGLMTNPPFNPDDIDATKIKKNKKMINFGTPSINKKGKITTSGGNYVWISQFHSYLKPGSGRGGFVMATSATSASGSEQIIRKKLIETGDVYCIVSIAPGFFYTRPLPCDLWFLDRGLDDSFKEKVLMIDANSVYTEMTSTINEFSPEQENNLLAIKWLYSGDYQRYLSLLEYYATCANSCLIDTFDILKKSTLSTEKLENIVNSAIGNVNSEDGTRLQSLLDEATNEFDLMKEVLTKMPSIARDYHESVSLSENLTNDEITTVISIMKPTRILLAKFAESFLTLERNFIQCLQTINSSNKASSKNKSTQINIKQYMSEIRKIRADINRMIGIFSRYFDNASWLTQRFPDAKYTDVLGLCKIVGIEELSEQKFSLAPVRYVGMEEKIVEKESIIKNRLKNIHQEILILDSEERKLFKKILSNLAEVLDVELD
jgi:type I restriction enzyme M protein